MRAGSFDDLFHGGGGQAQILGPGIVARDRLDGVPE